MIANYSIIKLTKNRYDSAHTTPSDPTPRLLVIKVYDVPNQYLVRYPDNHVTRVNHDWVLTKGTFELDHISYITHATTMRAVTTEFRKNEIYSNIIRSIYPTFAIELNQFIVARQQAYAERNAAPPVTVQDIVSVLPTVAEATNSQDDTVTLLKSIDNSLKTLVQLWGGHNNG